MSETRFSDNNTPFMVRDLEDETCSDPPRPQPMKRGTNEWLYYFGLYPEACAAISSEAEIRSTIGKNGCSITRHVLFDKLDSDLLMHPTSKIQVAVVQQELIDKIELIYSQLQAFASTGVITCKKYSGGAQLEYQGELITLSFKVCDDSGMFHVLISKPSRWMSHEITYPEMENVTPLIYCLRMIFITPGIYPSFDFEIEDAEWKKTQSITMEQLVS